MIIINLIISHLLFFVSFVAYFLSYFLFRHVLRPIYRFFEAIYRKHYYLAILRLIRLIVFPFFMEFILIGILIISIARNEYIIDNVNLSVPYISALMHEYKKIIE